MSALPTNGRKFLYMTDVSEAPGQQNVLMYTVDIFNKSADAKQGELLKSMADTNGPGGYFKVGGDIKALVDALKNILSRITAVNSVFASASLPVSVNAQGTFLNQIFMGVFRPDDKSQQRWHGNLKQYQLALSGSTLTLVDAGGKAGCRRQLDRLHQQLRQQLLDGGFQQLTGNR